MTNINNQIHKIYFVTISLFFIAVAIFSLSVMTVNAEDGFKLNSNGEYEISNAAGFNEFKNQVLNGNTFQNQTILRNL